MRRGCCGNCHQGTFPCTMPGVCGRPVSFPTRRSWWRRNLDLALWIVLGLAWAAVFAYEAHAAQIVRAAA